MRLAPGQACAACLSREAWSHWQAKGVLVIDRATIEASEARRAGTHRRRILGIATSAAATLVSLGLATACVWAVAALFAPRGIGSPAVIVASIRDSGWRVVAWGSACAGLSAGALRLSAPGRLRAIFTAARLGGVVGGSAAALLGGLVLYVAKDAWSIDYLSMPARVDWGEVGEAVQRARDAVAVVVAPDADGDARAGALGAAAVVGGDADRVFLLTCSHVAMPYVAVGAGPPPPPGPRGGGGRAPPPPPGPPRGGGGAAPPPRRTRSGCSSRTAARRPARSCGRPSRRSTSRSSRCGSRRRPRPSR